MDQQCIPQQALYWQVPGYKRGPGRPTANWKGVVSKDLRYERWGSPGRKQRWQLLTDTDAIGVWPNVSSSRASRGLVLYGLDSSQTMELLLLTLMLLYVAGVYMYIY